MQQEQIAFLQLQLQNEQTNAIVLRDEMNLMKTKNEESILNESKAFEIDELKRDCDRKDEEMHTLKEQIEKTEETQWRKEKEHDSKTEEMKEKIQTLETMSIKLNEEKMEDMKKIETSFRDKENEAEEMKTKAEEQKKNAFFDGK